MAKILIAFVCLVVIQSCLALKCKENDPSNEKSFIDKDCISPGASQESACLTETYKDTENVEHVVKKCVLYQKGGVYQCVPISNARTVECKICKNDLCNAAPSMAGFSVLTLIGLVMAYLVPKVLI